MQGTQDQQYYQSEHNHELHPIIALDITFSPFMEKESILPGRKVP
jgi:hypothetical protein